MSNEQKLLPSCYPIPVMDMQLQQDVKTILDNTHQYSSHAVRLAQYLSRTPTDTSQQQVGNDLSDFTFELMQLSILEKSQRIHELEKALADATVQINQLMGGYDSE